jgi:hypothetical protein
VEAAVDNGGSGDDYDRQSLRSRVQGLSYDARVRELVYLAEGVRVVCAKVIKSRFLLTTQTRIAAALHKGADWRTVSEPLE